MSKIKELYEVLTGTFTEKSKNSNEWKLLNKVFKTKELYTFDDLEFDYDINTTSYSIVIPKISNEKDSKQVPSAVIYFDNDLGIKVTQLWIPSASEMLYDYSVLNRGPFIHLDISGTTSNQDKVTYCMKNLQEYKRK